VKEAVQAQIDERENRRVAAIVEAQEKKLSPGKFVWQPELAPNGPMEIVVSLNAQRAYIFRKERLIGVTTVSTGRKGHERPTGSFPILQKKKMHFSNLYNDAPMPFMQRMNWDGIALHAGNIPGVPASHGCVRLPKEFSELLYQETRIGSIVHVVDELPGGAVTALAHARDEAFRAMPRRRLAPLRRPPAGQPGAARRRGFADGDVGSAEPVSPDRRG
jgi:hypothetical protein